MTGSEQVRHVVRLGRPGRLDALLLRPEAGLRAQARQAGLAEGLGVGWYPAPEFGRPGTRPVRYRRAGPLWADAGFAAVAGEVESRCVLAAVRGAPEGAPADESACPPHLLQDVLLSCDVEAPGLVAALGRLVPSAALASVGATVPGAFVAALVGARLTAGDAPGVAAQAAARLLLDRVPGAALSLLVTDGHAVAAVAAGRALVLRAGDGAVLLASSPADDEPGWEPVPDGSVVSATLDGVETTAL